MRSHGQALRFLPVLILLPVASAQFKVIGPAPYTQPVARQRMKDLLQKTDPANRSQTIQTISGLLDWYRDIFDEELIAAWQRNEGRENLAELMKPLADARVAAAIRGILLAAAAANDVQSDVRSDV